MTVKRVIIAVSFFVFAVYFQMIMVLKSFMLTTNWNKEWRIPTGFHLNDIGFRFIAYWQEVPGPVLWLAPFANMGVGLMMLITLFRFLYHRSRLDIFRRIMFISGMLYLMRAFTIVITSLPDPFKECGPDYWNVPVDQYSLFVIVFQKFKAAIVDGAPLDCGDVFFSGHTATLTEFSLAWMTYTKNLPMKIFVWMLSAFTVFCMIAAYFHYTLDIVFGFLISLTLWKTYHRLANDPVMLAKWRLWGMWESTEEGRSLAWLWRVGPIMFVRKQIPWTPPRWLIHLDDDREESDQLLTVNATPEERHYDLERND
eukprot:TRINITY_DN2036_c0_g1_i1.p1 TRINITY_DN2036_c0_g1~~TRINITY_DN2036_c0_g1_i1.p1  ORF type:complete len:312 (+),score=35.60 TRINITY_DN2036_c0_g1_i1:208-1143(+)